MFVLEYTRQASRMLESMPRNVRAVVEGKIAAVCADPHGRHNNATRLQGRPEFRLRVGDWRVIYRVIDERVTVLIVKIGSRGQVY
ncbi:MAG: type II toxin-antitoxin system RelE family toxin [Betaproteobacteria bacterium]